MSRDITQESKKVRVALPRRVRPPSPPLNFLPPLRPGWFPFAANNTVESQPNRAALCKLRALVRAQFAAMPPRDVLRYNKSIGWSHQEFVEAWGLWRYVIGTHHEMNSFIAILEFE